MCLKQQFNDLDLFNQAEQHNSTVQQGWLTWDQQREYETIDWEATAAWILAECWCCKFKFSKIHWSLEKTMAIYWVLYWKGVCSRENRYWVGSSVLQSRIKKGGLTHNLNVVHLPAETLKEELQKAYWRYHQHKSDPNSHDTWIGQLIEVQAQDTSRKKATLWKQCWSWEHIKCTAHQVKFVLGKLMLHCLLLIVCPSGRCQQLMRMHNKTRIGTGLSCWSRMVLHSPCLSMPLCDIFGELGVHQQAFDKVLEGQFVPPPECNQYITKVLKHLRNPPEVPVITLPTLPDYIHRWQCTWEETSSSYSTIHFGHYMAGTHDEHIAKFNALMASIPAATRYSPTWWWHGLNVMLENSLGNTDVEWLWIILLFKADCNQNNRWLVQVFMKEAELANLLADEQYGSCHFKDALKMRFHNAWINGCGMISSKFDGSQWHFAWMMHKVVMTA